MPVTWFSVWVFAVSFATYLLLAGSLTGTEEAAGAGAALAMSAYVVAQHPPPGRALALHVPPARVLRRTASALWTDTVQVGAALVRALVSGEGGEAGWQAFRPGGRSPEEAGHRALLTLLASVAPNGFVMDLRPSALPDSDRALLVHRLAPASPSGDTDWPA